VDIAIETHQLTVAYNAEPAVWNLNVQIPLNAMTAIVGPNGAGKSTLLKAILGTVRKLSGSISLHPSIGNHNAAIGYVPQRSSVDWDFPTTVFDVVLMGTYGRLRWFQRPGKKERAEAMDALRQVQMDDLADRQIGELSGGQQQRVFLARAFVQQASVYLMDEPFAGVDARTEGLIIEVLRERQRAGNTIVLVHHDLASVSEYFDHVALINQKLVACGPTPATFTRENVALAYGSVPKQLP